ncbi:hypothetical protein WJX82_010938 [Trebouxia sp. C0006]
MPRIRKLECEVHEAECQCYKQSIPVAQSLEELDYLKSACAAAQQGNEAKLHAILEKHPQATNSDGSEGGIGYTPLHYAARAGHLGAVRLLLARGADPNRTTRAGGATALHRACYMGHTAVAEALIASGCDAAVADSDGHTALHKAAQQGHVLLLQSLQTRFPAAAALQSKKGLTAEQLLPSASTTYTA